MGDESVGDIVLRKQREPTSFPCRRQPGGRGKPAGRSLMRRRLRHERHPLGTAGRGGHGGGDSGLNARKPGIVRPRSTGRGDGPPEVGCVARRDSRAGKGGNVSWVASALLHSDGRADGRRSCEIAPCLQNGRMGTEYTGTDRDSRPCTGAKDLWGPRRTPWKGSLRIALGAGHWSQVGSGSRGGAQEWVNRVPAGVGWEQASPDRRSRSL